METSDTIKVVGIVVQAIIAVVIVYVLQDKLSNNRAIKNFLTDELREIRDDYNKFFKELNKGERDFKYILEWFKVMYVRIDNHENFLKQKLKIKNTLLIFVHSEFRKKLTSHPEFNNSFEHSSVQLSPQLKTEIMKHYTKFNRKFPEVIIKINEI